MKTFIILNGTELYFIECEDMRQAKHKAIEICDHSKEVIVRRIESIQVSKKTTQKNLFKTI